MEIIAIATKIALAIGAIYAAVKGIIPLLHWLRARTLIKLEELKRLRKIETEYKKYEVLIEQQKLRSVEVAAQVHRALGHRVKAEN